MPRLIHIFTAFTAAVLITWTSGMAVATKDNAGPAPQIIVLGDSLAAGYGLDQGDGFTAQLRRWLAARGHDIPVVNAGVSGDTSSGGAARLDWILPDPGRPESTLVVVELGGNDGLRGIDPATTRDNIDSILKRLTERGYHVLLAGMLAPPNMGDDYETEFNKIYPALADHYDVPLYPFFLDGVAAKPGLMQDDGLHPNKEGVRVIVEKIGPVIENLLHGMRRNAS